MSSRKRKILTLEFSVGVTDVHSVPVPIETQDVRINPPSAQGRNGCGSCTLWQLHVVAAARYTTSVFTF